MDGDFSHLEELYQGALQIYTAVPSIEDTAPSEYWVPAEEPRETEEEKQARMWKALVEASQT